MAIYPVVEFLYRMPLQESKKLMAAIWFFQTHLFPKHEMVLVEQKVVSHLLHVSVTLTQIV
jgi:hypothetical protein